MDPESQRSHSNGAMHSRTFPSTLREEQFSHPGRNHPLEYNSGLVQRSAPALADIPHDDPPPPYDLGDPFGSPQVVPIEFSDSTAPQLAVEYTEYMPGSQYPEVLLSHSNRSTASTSRPSLASVPVGSSSGNSIPRKPIASSHHPAPIRSLSQPSIPLQYGQSNPSLPPYGNSSTSASTPRLVNPESMPRSKAVEAGYQLYPENQPTLSMSSLTLTTTQEEQPDEVGFARDPQKLFAYLVPFPKPRLQNCNLNKLPARFLIYTPPPPPQQSLKGKESMSRMAKKHQKWQDDIRRTAASDAKATSWDGMKARSLRGLGKVVSKTKSSQLDFASRVQLDGSNASQTDIMSEQNSTEHSSHRGVSVREIVLVYPSTVTLSEEELRSEFINSMLRKQTKAQRDAILASGLIPIATAIDLSLMVIWPFGGLTEHDRLWQYSSLYGAKARKDISSRLTSVCTCGHHEHEQLKLSFVRSEKLPVMEQYLSGVCWNQDTKLFGHPGIMVPTEDAVIDAMGWGPSLRSDDAASQSDSESWEHREIRLDLKGIFLKASKEWIRWSKAYETDPEAALKKV